MSKLNEKSTRGYDSKGNRIQHLDLTLTTRVLPNTYIYSLGIFILDYCVQGMS